MHLFLSLAAALVLVQGQVEPAEPAPAAQPAPQEDAPPKPADPPPPAEAKPPRAAATPPAPENGAVPPPRVSPSPSPGKTAEPERAQVARAALAFLDALVAGDPSALAAASSERFSFDGELRTGKDEVRRTWQAVVAGRDPSQRGALLDLEILSGADAVTRLGAPPARLAPLAAQKGGWVAIANVSRRPVVLFLSREGARFAVTGME